MIQIIKIFNQDNAVASKAVEVMFCSSFEEARQCILNDICVGFGEEWDSLESAANDLESDLSYCSYEDDSFVWSDNGQGVEYMIGEVDMNKKEFQCFNVF